MNQPLIKLGGSDWVALAPVLVLFGVAMIVLLVDALFPRLRVTIPWLAMLGAAGGLIAEIVRWQAGPKGAVLGFYSMLVDDRFGVLMNSVILIGAIITILLSVSYIRREELEHGEYYSLILLASGGMMLMASSADLIMIFLSLEIFSIALYILSAFARTRAKSEEAGMKYLLLGAFSSAFLLYGIALTYGATGTTNMPRIAATLAGTGIASNSLLLVGVGLLLVGLGFKVSAVPFQVWTPDVYEGAPTSVTAFMSVGTKVAAFAAIARVFIQAMGSIRPEWMPAVWVLAALTMIGGNLVAVAQSNIKRMLAYSSIAHAGYILIAVAAANSAGIASIPYYLFAYAFMNMGAWAVAIIVAGKGETRLDLPYYAGLFWRNPGLAVAMGLFMFGLAGIPPTGGFTAKFYVFLAALDRNLTGLVIIGVLTTVVSVYYYLRITVLMFMNRPDGDLPPVAVPATVVVALVITALGTLVLGVYPAPFIELAQRVLPLKF